MLKQLEVHEGVDMFKERIPDEAKKHKQSHALRAAPKKMRPMHMEATKMRKKLLATKAKKTSAAPRPRGRAPNGTRLVR